MENTTKIVKKHNLILPGEKIGVAVSGGADSMALLHSIHNLSKTMGFQCVAITIDHGLRAESGEDAAFVASYCNQHGIECSIYKANVLKLSQEKGYSVEMAAREARYRIFRVLIKRELVSKIALGHHMQDQAETILLNLFRGTGLSGAGGMDLIRDNVYIRPQLHSTRKQIMEYIVQNDIPYVEDESNNSNEYNRNYIRNSIMPLIKNRWQNADEAICSFGELCKSDDEYIESTVNDLGVVYEAHGVVKLPMYCFDAHTSVVNRLLRKAFKSIGVVNNIERKHLNIINSLAKEAENGSKISLPNRVSVFKEYNFITLTNKKFVPEQRIWEVEKGKIDVPNFGVIEMQVTRKLDLQEYTHLVDYTKIPKDAVWRYRRDGDIFTKFGGGTKTLSDFFIDRKIPQRYRANMPVLAIGREILVVAGVEISDKVKVNEQTKTAWGINAVRF